MESSLKTWEASPAGSESPSDKTVTSLLAALEAGSVLCAKA